MGPHTMSAGDNRLGAVNQHEDPAESWAMLKMMFLEGSRSTTSYSNANQQTLWHGNGGGRRDINTYLTEAMDMRNQLIKAHI